MNAKHHLARVRAMGCIICGAPAVPHHIRSLANGSGTGHKSSDLMTIPLCNPHHTTGGYGVAYHAGPAVWEERFGRQMDLLAQVLEELGIEA